jgi:hypothetical protein
VPAQWNFEQSRSMVIRAIERDFDDLELLAQEMGLHDSSSETSQPSAGTLSTPPSHVADIATPQQMEHTPSMTPFQADIEPIRGSLRPVEIAPVLWTLNGCGTTLLGQLRPSIHSHAYFTRRFVTALWVPIIPLGVFLVENASHNSFRFLAKINPEDFHRTYSSSIGRFYFGAVALSLGLGVAVIAIFLLIAWIFSLFGGHGHGGFVRFRL